MNVSKAEQQNTNMEKYILSTDGKKICYTEMGTVTLVFVHGWLGNIDWWKHQEAYFAGKYNVVRIDLGGHGKSDKSRQNWTSEQYADDISTVVNGLDASEVILVGHSMSGAYVVEACIKLPQVKAIVLIDTLKDLEQDFTPEMAEQYMFSNYRTDFKSAIENLLPQYLFTDKTPTHIKRQLQDEFLQNEAQLAIDALRPLYEMNIRELAKLVSVPVRAINSDASPTSNENNSRYFKDYNCEIIAETGHYPMLEKPNEFNKILDKILVELASE